MTTRTAGERDLVALLGDTRAAVVRILKRAGARTVAELAAELQISDVAVRKHLTMLEADGFVEERELFRQLRGRPAARFGLTERAGELFPNHGSEVAGELIQFLSDVHGREAVREFLKWRQAREADRYGAQIDADDVEGRLTQLADALSAAGFDASVNVGGDALELTQSHCAVYDIAREHPELCAHEASMFRGLLGDGVSVSRRQTIAKGDHACVCTVTTRTARTMSDRS